MTRKDQFRWLTYHREKILDTRAHSGQVFNFHYGIGTIVREWGQFEDDAGRRVPGDGVFDVLFVRDGKMHPINADNLTLIK